MKKENKSVLDVLNEKQITSRFNERDESSPDPLRTLINFEVFDSSTNEHISISEIGKSVTSAYVVADVVEPLPVTYRQKVGEMACTVKQQDAGASDSAGNAGGASQPPEEERLKVQMLSQFVSKNANTAKFDRSSLQVSCSCLVQVYAH